MYEIHDQNSHTLCHYVLWNYSGNKLFLFCWGPPWKTLKDPHFENHCFKVWCVRMVTIWMCLCPISAWTLEPNWHFTLLFHLNLFNSETNRRQKCKCGVFTNDEAQLLHCRASARRVNRESSLESPDNLACVVELFFFFFFFSSCWVWIKVLFMFQQMWVFGSVWVACTVPYDSPPRPRPHGVLSALSPLNG